MGNEQSHEQVQTEDDVDIDESDSFDLEAIEDSREYIARPPSNRSASSPAEASIMARDAAGKFKRRKKKIKKGSNEQTSQDTSSPSPIPNEQAQDHEEPEGSPLVDGLAEADSGFEELRRREPEQFGDYDNSDESEDDKEKVLLSVEKTNGLKKEIVKSDLEGEDGKASSSLSEENKAAEDESPGTSNQHRPHTDSTVDNTITTASQRKSRYPCPHAEEYDCNKTFSRAETAYRHGKSHTSPFICPVCQKQLARQDSLNHHLKQHSTDEIAKTHKSALDVIEANDGVGDVGGPAITAAHDVESDQGPAPPDLPTQPPKDRFPCPLASSFQCEKTYSNEKGALRHAQVHTTDLSCPLGCHDPKTGEIMTFCHERSRARHLKNGHVQADQQKAKGILLARETESADVVLDGGAPRPDATQAHAEFPISDLAEATNEDVIKTTDFMFREERDRHAIGVETDLIDEGTPVDDHGDVDLGNTMDVDTPEQNNSVLADKPQSHSTRKRKRNDHTSPHAVPDQSPPSKKPRQRQVTPAPDPTLEDSEASSKFVGVFLGTPDRPRARVQGEPAQRRQSRINNFVQPYVAGSTLRHPLFHPESPALTKHVRRTSSDEQQADGAQDRSFARGKRKAQATPRIAVTTKGKERAVSVDDDIEHERAVNGVGASGVEIASAMPLPKSKSKRKKVASGDRESDDIETGQSGSSTEGAARKGGGVSPLVAARNVVCRTCKRKFKNRRRLEIHESSPKSHRSLLECEECGEHFYHVFDLRKHEKVNGHKTGSVEAGPSGRRFSTLEEATIQRWARLFREEHDLTLEQFKEMMQSSYRRDMEWKNDFITRSEFTQEYFDLLPDRDVASMRRYRDKHFDVANTSKVWSTYEDDEIIRLHEELGPTWSRIGKEMNRPGEMVRQRYKNKLSLTRMATGDWSKLEETAFCEAVEQVRRVSDVAAGGFNWTSVSKKMQTRTPQQCANHWRAKYAGTRTGDSWKSYGESPMKIPHEQLRSKMEQRLAGESSASPKKLKVVSQEYVKESEDEEGAKVAARDDDSQEEGSGSGSGTRKSKTRSAIPEHGDGEEDVTRPPESESESEKDEEEDEKENEPELPRYPLADVTPGKTLRMSQVFNQTQANTSAKRLSPHRGSQGPSQERPSPSVAIQHQRERSPELGSPVDDLDEIEKKEDEKASVSADENDNKEDMLGDAGQENTEDEAQDEEEDDVTTESESEQMKTKHISASVSRPDTAITSTTSTDTGSDSESDSSAASNSTSSLPSNSPVKSESDSSTSSPSHSPPPWLASKAHPSSVKKAATNKKLAEVSNAFMDSINATVSASARKRAEAQAQTKQKGKRKGKQKGKQKKRLAIGQRSVRSWVGSDSDSDSSDD